MDTYVKVVFVRGISPASDYHINYSPKYIYKYNSEYELDLNDVCLAYKDKNRLYDNYCQIVKFITEEDIIDKDRTYKEFKPKDIYRNGELIKSNLKYNMKAGKTMSGMFDKIKAQYIPTKEDGLKLSFSGILCVPVGDEYIGMDQDNNLTSFPAEMCMDIPVYSIVKPVKDIAVGDVIKRGNSYVKVIEKKENGSLRCLSYNGYYQNKKEVTDFFMNQATERVIWNIFNMNQDNSLNPMMFALMNEDCDMKDIMMMSMMQGQQMNPMLMMCMMGDDSSDMMKMMMMSQMMGGNNPFANMFNNGKDNNINS